VALAGQRGSQLPREDHEAMVKMLPFLPERTPKQNEFIGEHPNTVLVVEI